jgi:hypothetical protein
MPVTINASTTNGLVATADGSGVMKLQSNGKTTNALVWVNLNGVTTVTIRSSYNISSVVRNAAGDYTLNFTNALNDANYAILGTSATGNYGVFSVCPLGTNGTYATTTACRVVVGYTNLGTSFINADSDGLSVAIFGN